MFWLGLFIGTVMTFVLSRARATATRATALEQAARERATAEAELTQRLRTMTSHFSNAAADLSTARTAAESMSQRLVKDAIKSASSRLTSANYTTTKAKLQSLFAFCAKHGYAVPEAD